MQVIAQMNNLRISYRKVRLVANLINGLTVEKAMMQLTFSKKAAAKELLKLLKSALANAKENYDLTPDNLKVASITVDAGLVLKRWQPKAFGRATPIRKETSRVKVILEEIVASGKTKKEKKIDTSDIIKVGTGEFDELKDITGKQEGKKEIKKAKASDKGFASKILNRKTGSK
ncbi:MAG: 50S ribosomal protein L22 [Candidatus Buchananbacteria bacterium]